MFKGHPFVSTKGPVTEMVNVSIELPLLRNVTIRRMAGVPAVYAPKSIAVGRSSTAWMTLLPDSTEVAAGELVTLRAPLLERSELMPAAMERVPVIGPRSVGTNETSATQVAVGARLVPQVVLLRTKLEVVPGGPMPTALPPGL